MAEAPLRRSRVTLFEVLGKVGHDDPLGQMEPVSCHSTSRYEQTLPTGF